MSWPKCSPKPNDADRVDHRGLETAVDRDDGGPGRHVLVGHAFQQGLREPLEHGTFGRHVDEDDLELVGRRSGERLHAVARQQHGMLADRFAELRPFGGPLHQEQHGVGGVERRQLVGLLAEHLQLIGEFACQRHGQAARIGEKQSDRSAAM